MLRGPIIEEIRRHGAIGFDRFMEIALYDAGAGYFSTGSLRSERTGDFLTSPEVSPLFGATLAGFVGAEWRRLGNPFALVEVGGGSGSLLRPLLDALDRVPRVVAYERSAAALASITEMVPEAEVVDESVSLRGVIIANELLDNMPAALVVRHGSEWVERRVGAVGGELALVETPPRPEVAEWADHHSGPVPEGGQVEVQRDATEWLRGVLGALEEGALLAFDYGELAENLEHRRVGGTVRTYRSHHLGPDPLAEPGATDITMDVNFSAMIAAAESAGAQVEYLRQDEFLERWGLRGQIDELRAAEGVAAREGRVMDQLRLKSDITGGETLVHPRGLGDFRVMIARKSPKAGASVGFGA